ncbi:hypothetical protein EI534_21375 [Pseudomonas frederiksbergensis]|nr:hypothetical protein [Pseudomonas frederiksbergensis]
MRHGAQRYASKARSDSYRLTQSLWERACPRLRCISRHEYCLTYRHRGQARSHREFVWLQAGSAAVE